MTVDALTTYATNAQPWDYSDQAATYEHRADYVSAAIERLLRHLPRAHTVRAVDIGADTGKLTRSLLAAGMAVVAIEPNESMRAVAARIPLNGDAQWICARAEQLPLESNSFDLACFGSSFNVVDAARSLDEVSRVLTDDGILAIMWNHRDLNDSLQAAVESVIRAHLPDFSHGSRREDPTTEVLKRKQLVAIDSFRCWFEWVTAREHYMAAWRSHATLARAAGSQLEAIIDDICSLVPSGEISVPFSTAVWLFRKRAK